MVSSAESLLLAAACVALLLLAAAAARRAGGRSEGYSQVRWRGSPSGTRWAYGARPACDDCRGLTSGAMPAIEPTDDFGNGICCGRLGVPPP